MLEQFLGYIFRFSSDVWEIILFLYCRRTTYVESNKQNGLLIGQFKCNNFLLAASRRVKRYDSPGFEYFTQILFGFEGWNRAKRRPVRKSSLIKASSKLIRNPDRRCNLVTI